MKRLSFLLALLLAGCSGSDNRSPANASLPAPPAEAVADAYVLAVKHAASAAPDDAEPMPIDTIAATVPDDIEPAVL